MASPIPLLAPVTSARLPFKLRSIASTVALNRPAGKRPCRRWTASNSADVEGAHPHLLVAEPNRDWTDSLVATFRAGVVFAAAPAASVSTESPGNGADPLRSRRRSVSSIDMESRDDPARAAEFGVW